MKQFRPIRREEEPTPELVARIEKAQAKARENAPGAAEELLAAFREIRHTDADVHDLIAGEEIIVTADAAWETGEEIEILDADWKVVCHARVVALPIPGSRRFRLRGLRP
mgnify:CR=1 FL=1